jgi:hypothetical protein
MTTREKIIVGLMCITILYGAYELFGNRNPRNSHADKNANPVEELKGFTASVTKKLFDEKVSQEYRYLIDQAGQNWTKDPFIHSTTPLTKELALANLPKKSSGERPAHPYVYSGFLQLGETKLAVINGMEYAVGESLDTKGLYIKSISVHNVVVANVDGRVAMQLPLTELNPTFKNQTP